MNYLYRIAFWLERNATVLEVAGVILASAGAGMALAIAFCQG